MRIPEPSDSPPAGAGGLNILHVVTRNQRRGAESSAVELAERLTGRGHRTRVVALAAADRGSTLPVPVLGRRTLAPGGLWRLRVLLRSVDVVIAHGSRTLPAVVLASAGLRTARVYQNIGDPSFWAGTRSRRARVRWQLARMSAVAALTDGALVTLRETFGLPPDRLFLVRNWRDGDVFRPAAPEQRSAARDSVGVPRDASVVAVVGALSEEKHVELAVAAVGGRPSLWLLVVGDGPLRAGLESLAQRLAPGRVRFVGSLADVRPALHASDVLLLSSRSEGVPGVLIEAGLCGLPAVATAVGFVPDVVADGDTGILVPGRSPEEVAAALDRALADRARLGPAARDRCLQRFDTRVVLDQWEDLLHAVAPHAAGPVNQGHAG